MSEVFIDSSGWGAFCVRSQPSHLLARAFMDDWEDSGVHLVTTNYVLAELVALLMSPLRVPRPHRLSIYEIIEAATRLDVVHIDPRLDREAWSLLKARSDKDWSLVDCASFVVMKERGITEALTTDHHFEQAGFARLLD